MTSILLNKLPDVDAISHSLCLDRLVSSRFKRYLLEFLLESYGVRATAIAPDLECFVNAQSNTYSYQGNSEVNNIAGSIQLCPVRSHKAKDGSRKIIVKSPDCRNLNFSECRNLYDSGAFPEVMADARVTPQISLQRQLDTLSNLPAFKETFLVSYDRLIDEKHINGERVKQRWTVEDGELAVNQTVEAAAFLHSQRNILSKYTLVQSCQGVDAPQYLKCVEQVLSYCHPSDIVGLGGWCILGRQSSYLNTFWKTINLVIPAIASAGITKIHIFGCTWYKPRKANPIPPLQPLLWLCDRYGISLSTDGRSPIGNALWKNGWENAGAIFPYWRHNLAWVKTELATLRDSASYKSPPGWTEPVMSIPILEKSNEKDIFPIPEKSSGKKFEPVGCLYPYIETKKLKDGTEVLYPRVIGKRDRTNPHHWRWGFNWKEKHNNAWKGRSIGSIPCSAVPMIRDMQSSGSALAQIIEFILKAKKESKTSPYYPNPLANLISRPTPILFNSHFSGCGGSARGAIAAGFTLCGAIENNPQIAELYKANCGDILVADITTVDFKKLNIPTQLERRRFGQILVTQTSPPCQDFSTANTKSSDRNSDRANILRETWLYYEIFRPEYVILENVPAYRYSKPYQDFEQYLISLGYTIVKVVLNAADYGVPQTRVRFFAIAVQKDYPIPQINPTHECQRHGQLSLIRQPWIGWYEALKDLLPLLPESKLTEKQKKAIAVLETKLVDQQNSRSVALGYKTRPKDKPSFTLGCNAQAKVLLINGKQNGARGERQIRDASDPCWTITASIHKGVPRAVLVERIGYYNSPKTAQTEEPCWTLRAALADDYHKGSRTKMIDAILEGADVRSLNTFALARLQSFDDSYQWSGKSSIDMRGIGNSVAPKMMGVIAIAIRNSLNQLLGKG